MCGIFGIYSQNQELPQDEYLIKAAKVLTHRGPDHLGWHKEKNLFLAHNRLKIIDLTEAGNQPLSNEDGTIWLVFNGEIYNYRQLQKELKLDGHKFSSCSDSEVIIHLYEKYGKNCLNRLRGMYAFAIWDKKKQSIFAARDHLGIKPLYYTYQRDYFILTSEIKVFTSLKFLPIKLDIQAVYDYLTFGAVPAPQTILENLKSLLPAHLLEFKDNRLSIQRYWQIKPSGSKPLSSRHRCSNELRRLLEEAISTHMVSDLPVGAFLSGGIDSTIIVGLMSQLSQESVRTFTVGYDVKEGFDETSFARLVADRFSTNHTEVILTENDIFTQLGKAIWHMDQPSHDALNSYFVSQAAKQAGLTVAFSGLGADEIFAGYSSFKFAKLLEDISWLTKRVPRSVTSAWRQLQKFLPLQFQHQWFWKGVSGALGCYPKLSQQYHQAKLFFGESEKIKLCRRDFFTQLNGYYSSESRLDRLADFDGGDVINKVSYLELNSYLPYTLLRDTDAMSMANSLEVRVPFLDRKVVEFSISIPGAYKYSQSSGKSILIESLKDIIPTEIANRRKRGFSFPLGVWLKRKALKEIVGDCLSKRAIENRGFFNYKTVEKYRNSFYRSDNSHAGQLYMKIWLLTVLELWNRIYLDSHDSISF